MRDGLVWFRDLPRRVVQVQYRGGALDQPQTDEELLEQAFELDEEALRNGTPKRHVKEFFLDLRDTQRRSLEYAEQLISKRPEWTHELKPIVYDVFDDDDDGTASVSSNADPASFPTFVE